MLQPIHQSQHRFRLLFDQTKCEQIRRMKRNVFLHETSQFAVVFFILIQSTAIWCSIYECPTQISEYCKCDDKQNTIFFRCTKNNTEISLKSGWRSTLTFNCTNANDSAVFQLMNFNENNQNIVVNVLRIYSCPRSVITLIESKVIQYIKQKSLEIVMSNGNLLPDNFFNSQTMLEHLDLRQNNLTSLPEHIFQNLTNLKILNLNDNQLTELAENIFENQTALTDLHLNGNSLTTLLENTFSELTKLKILYLNENRLTTLPENIFRNLTQLQDLDLSQNNFTTLPPNIFNGLPPHRLELQLEGNPWLCDCDLLQMIRERAHKVDYNEILCPDEIPVRYKLDLPIISIIWHKSGDGTYDNPEYKNHTFCDIMPTSNLTRICPIGCNCLIFEEDTAIYMDCSNSGLKSLPAGLGNDIQLLPQLQSIELNFENNALERLPYSTMQGFELIGKIAAKNNSIQFIDIGNLPGNLTEIDLSENKMEYLSTAVIQQFSDMKMLKKLTLHGNPWLCDCDFLDIVRQTRNLVDYGQIKCVDGELVHHKLERPIISIIANKPGDPLSNTTEYKNRTICPIHPTNRFFEMCSAGCNCLILEYNTTIIFDCSNSDLENVPWKLGKRFQEEMPSLQEIHLNFENNRIKTLPFSTMTGFKLVTKLIAKNNVIESIYVSNLPPRLTTIDLRENKLVDLSSAVTKHLTDMSTLKQIDLNGNPWACDETFLEFIRNNMEKVDYNTIVCSNREPLFRGSDHITFWITNIVPNMEKAKWITSSEIVRKIDYKDYLGSLCPIDCNCFIQEMNTTILYACSVNNYTNIFSHFESGKEGWPSLNLFKLALQ